MDITLNTNTLYDHKSITIILLFIQSP